MRLSDLHRRILAGKTLDPDAVAFLTAAGITDASIKNAIDTLVKGLKGNNLWSKMKALYPFVGGDASKHSYNLFNPNTFQVTWFNSVTHNSNGITGNGTNAYGNTNLNENTVLTSNNSHISIYQRNIPPVPSQVSMGAGTAGFSRFYLNFSGSNFSTLQGGAQSSLPIVSPLHGMFTMSRQSSTSYFRKQNALATEFINNNSGTKNNGNFMLLANRSFSVANEFSIANLAFASIGDGMTDSEALTYYNLVQAFQTTLGRQV